MDDETDAPTETPTPAARWSAAVLGHRHDYHWPADDGSTAHQVALLQSAEFTEPVLVWDGDQPVAGYAGGQPCPERAWRDLYWMDLPASPAQSSSMLPVDPVAAVTEGWSGSYFTTRRREAPASTGSPAGGAAPQAREEMLSYLRDCLGEDEVARIGVVPSPVAAEAAPEAEAGEVVRRLLARADEAYEEGVRPDLTHWRGAVLYLYRREPGGEVVLHVEGEQDAVEAVEREVFAEWDWRVIHSDTTTREYDVTATVLADLGLSDPDPRGTAVDAARAEVEALVDGSGPGVERRGRSELASVLDSSMFLYRPNDGTLHVQVEGLDADLDTIVNALAPALAYRVVSRARGHLVLTVDPGVDDWRPAGPIQSLLAAPLAWAWLALCAVLTGLGAVADGALWRLLGTVAALSLLAELALRQQARDRRRR